MKHEVRRGRKFVEYHDDEQPEGTFTQEISGADVSYQDEAGSWRQLVEDWEADGADGFSFRASRMNHKVRFDSIGAWRWYPRRNVETEYLVLNRPQCWLTATKRWGNLLVNGISRENKTITLTSVRNVTRVIHSRWNGIKTDWILLNANAPTRFRQKVDLVGITEVDGVLFGADGQRLGQLMPTSATDSTFDEMGMPTQLPCSGSYANGYVEFQADVTGAVYPVTIDPDFSTRPSAEAGMDTDIYEHYRTYNYGTKTTLLINAAGGGWGSRALLKFDVSSISSSATVSAATLTVKIASDGGSGLTNKYLHRGLTQWYEGSNNGAAPDASQDGSTWNLRNANGAVAWAGGAGGGSNSDYVATATSNPSMGRPNTTADCTVTADVAGWVSGTTTNYGWWFVSTGSDWKEIGSSDHATESYRPVLTVTYTAGSTGVPKHFLHYARLRSN